MKKYVLLLLITLIGAGVTAVSGQGGKFSLSGTVRNIKEGKVYLQKYDNKMLFVIDSAQVVDGHFTFKTKPRLPDLYGITLDPSVDLLYPLYVFLEDNPITVEVDTLDSYEHSKVSGSALHDQYTAYKHSARSFKLDSFIRAHPSSLVPAYVMYRYYSFRLSPEEIEADIALFDRSLENTQFLRLLKSLPATLREAGVGKKAPNFQQWDTLGKSYKLYDHPGKYLFIDFWASWCPPCRQELPSLVKRYEKYHKAGLEILGVSFDKDKELWLKAIHVEKLPWQQVSDLKFWNNKVGQIYGIRLIPANVLIDPNGIIVARNLHGEELDRKLEDIFKN
jgi:peroxiredoxin